MAKNSTPRGERDAAGPAGLRASDIHVSETLVSLVIGEIHFTCFRRIIGKVQKVNWFDLRVSGESLERSKR